MKQLFAVVSGLLVGIAAESALLGPAVVAFLASLDFIVNE